LKPESILDWEIFKRFALSLLVDVFRCSLKSSYIFSAFSYLFFIKSFLFINLGVSIFSLLFLLSVLFNWIILADVFIVFFCYLLFYNLLLLFVYELSRFPSFDLLDIIRSFFEIILSISLDCISDTDGYFVIFSFYSLSSYLLLGCDWLLKFSSFYCSVIFDKLFLIFLFYSLSVLLSYEHNGFKSFDLNMELSDAFWKVLDDTFKFDLGDMLLFIFYKCSPFVVLFLSDLIFNSFDS